MTQPADDPRLSQVIADYLQEVDAGANPDPADYIRRHPDLASDLQAFFDGQAEVRRFADRIRSDDPDRIQPQQADPNSATQTHAPSATVKPVAPVLGTVRYFGDYELMSELARGGMGVVYQARQVSLNRVVALKMILSGQLASEADVRRFRQEAEAAAALDHPNILPIYEVGEHHGLQYFSMKLIGGASLTDRLKEPVVESRRPLVEVLATVCRAVHFAHQRGILHRDLKPANVLLDADGTPYVTDFGLAKKVEGDSGLTQSGAIVGTPSYMSPEQARAEKQLSTAADVYGLGAILYEVVAGRPPFRASTAAETLLEVMNKEAADPRSATPSADRDLSVIALKCLEKDPSRRYESAASLADELDRWLGGEPIRARPVSRFERARKWARRHPVEMALTTAIALALVAGTVSTAYYAVQADRRAFQAQVNADDANAQFVEATRKKQEAAAALERERDTAAKLAIALGDAWDGRRNAYVSDLARTANEWSNNNAALAAKLLDGCSVDFRGWEWHHLQRVRNAYGRDFNGVPKASTLGGFSLDGMKLLSISDGGVRVWDVATGKIARTFTGHSQTPTSAAFFPDGKRVASGSNILFRIGDRSGGEVAIWETDNGRLVRTIGTEHGGVDAVAVSSDGRLIASAGLDNKVRVWDGDSGNSLFTFDLPKAEKESTAGSLRGLAFRAGSTHLAASGSGGLTIWDTKTRAEVRRIPDEALPQYSRDGKRLLTLKESTTATVWDADSGKSSFSYRIPTSAVFSVAVRPDGEHMAIGGYDGLVRVFDVVGKKELHTLRGQPGQTMGLAYSPDGKWLATSHGDPIFELFGALAGRKPQAPTIRLWETGRAQEYRSVPYSGGGFMAHPKEPLVFVATGSEVHVYDLRTGERVRNLKAAPEAVTHLALSSDGAALAVAWEVPSKRVRQISPGAWEVKPDSHPGRLHVLDSVSGAVKVPELKAEHTCHELRFSPDSATLAVARAGGRADLVELSSGNVLATLSGADSGASRIEFTPDGRTLVRSVTGMIHLSDAEPERVTPGVIELWDVVARRKDRVIDTLDGHCHATALGPDGRTVAAAVGDDVWLIDLSKPDAEPDRVGAQAYALAFADGGQRLVTYTTHGVKVWDVRWRRDLLTLGGNWGSSQGDVGRVAFSSSGYVLATEADGLRVYDGREFVPPPSAAVVAKSSPKSAPKSAPLVDNRPESVRQSVKQSLGALKDDPGAALLHAVAALTSDSDPDRQRIHRLRVGLALQAQPKLRPLVPSGSTEPTNFVTDQVVDSPATANVSDPVLASYNGDMVMLSADGRRIVAWNRVQTEDHQERAKAAGRSPWTVRVFDARTGRPVGPAIDLGHRIESGRIAFAPDGTRIAAVVPLAVGDKGGSALVRVWDTQTGQRANEDFPVVMRSDKRGWLWFVAGGRLLLATSEEDRSTTPGWDMQTMTTFSLPEAFNKILGWEHSHYFVTASAGPAVVWDARTMKPVGKPLDRTGVTDAVVSENGSVAVMAYSYWVEAWDTATGEARHGRVVVRGGAQSLAITPDGTRFAAAFRGDGFKHLVRMWDSRTGEAIGPPIEHDAEVRDLRFTADGAALVTATEKQANVWDPRTGEALALLQSGDRDFGWGHPIRFALVDDVLFVQRTPETSQFIEYRLAGDPRPVDDLRAIAEALTGRRRSSDGSLAPIPADGLFRLRQSVHRRFPEVFGSPVAQANAVLTRRPDPRVRQLIDLVGDATQTARLRIAACEKLGELATAESEPALVSALHRDADATVRAAAARALAKLTPLSRDAITALVKSLQGELNARTRASAARALHGPAAKQMTGELIQSLKTDKAPEVRAGAAYALKDAPADGAGVRDALQSAIDKSQPWQVRVDAAGSLAQLYPNDSDCIVVLAAALTEATGWPQHSAVQYLYNLGPRAAPAVPGLAKLVAKEKYQSNFINATWYAVHTLMRIGPAAREAVPTLLQKLGEDDANPNWTSSRTNYPSPRENPFAYTLARIGPSCLPELMRVIREDKDPKRRLAAVLAVGYMGQAVVEAVPELERAQKALEEKDMLSDDEQWLQTALKKAVARIRDPKALPVEELMDK